MASSYSPSAAQQVATRQAQGVDVRSTPARSSNARCSSVDAAAASVRRTEDREVGVVRQAGRHLGQLVEPVGDPVSRRPSLSQLQGDVEERLDHGRAVLAPQHVQDAGGQVLAAELTVADHLEAGDDRERPVDPPPAGRLAPSRMRGPTQGPGPYGGDGEVAGVEQVKVGPGEARWSVAVPLVSTGGGARSG